MNKKQYVSKWENETKYETYIDCAEVNNCSMPDRENHPAPEDLEIEIDSLLPCLVHLRIPVYVLVINILLKSVSKEARPRGPQRIIKSLQPVCKENLAWEAIFQGKVYFSKDEHNILVEVVTDDPAHPAIALPSVD